MYCFEIERERRGGKRERERGRGGEIEGMEKVRRGGRKVEGDWVD